MKGAAKAAVMAILLSIFMDSEGRARTTGAGEGMGGGGAGAR
jgi:hypothetical protein